jgi:pimeloyl-ACP methyl ester carboxylesterase
MPEANVRGVTINYRVLGETGPWVTLAPGGRRALDGVLPLGNRIGEAGYRVLLHDRRNCGASDVAIEGDESEYEIWADDLYELLTQLDALPVYAGGSSSGCRLSLLLALRHPQAVRGLLLWRVTGGAFAANRLAENYYGQYMDAAKQGGMAAVCDTEHFAERIAAKPSNRDRLMAMDPERFIAVMSRWREYFLRSADLPVIGATAEQLGSINVPACVVPGHDRTHPKHVGEQASRLLPNGELQILFPEQLDVDLAVDDWNQDDKERELAAIFVDFLNRVTSADRAAAR